MKTFMIALLISSIPYFVYAQSSTYMVKLTSSKNAAVVFDSSYSEILIIPKAYTRITPTSEIVKSVESNILTQTKWTNSYIQFAGYIDGNKDTIILVSELSKKACRKSRQNWGTEFIYGLGAFYEKNQQILYYNLTKSKIVSPN